MENIRQIVIWGHKLHSHTHSYIHNGFFIAFSHLGYKTLWFDNSDDVSNIDFANSLFITEGQVHGKMPLNKTSFYVLHNCDMERYASYLPIQNYFVLQVYTHDVVNKHMATLIDKTTLTYHKDNTLYMPWATDLLPEEINKNIEKVRNGDFKMENTISFVGSMTRPWAEVNEFCRRANIRFEYFGGNSRNISVQDNITLTQKSILAPSFQDTWQCENGYIPCRIFKTISYGKMGITNNPTVHELYNRELIFHDNIANAMALGLVSETNERLIRLMEVTRDKHTYLNRIDQIFKFFSYPGRVL